MAADPKKRPRAKRASLSSPVSRKEREAPRDFARQDPARTNPSPLRLALLLLLTAITGIALTFAFYYGYYLQDYYETPIDLTITQSGLIGFNTGTDALHFGTLTPGSFSTRYVLIQPARDARLVVRITGGCSRYVFPQLGPSGENTLQVRAGEDVRVNITASIPEDASPGSCTGKAKFYMYRP